MVDIKKLKVKMTKNVPEKIKGDQKVEKIKKS